MVENADRGTLRRRARLEAAGTIEEILQDVFVSLWQGEGQALRGVSLDRPLEPWLAIVSVRRSLDFLRRRGRTPGASGFFAASMTSRSGLDPETAGEVRSALGSLPDRDQLILQMRVLDGLRYREISVLLGLRVGTVASLLARARRTLADRLKN